MFGSEAHYCSGYVCGVKKNIIIAIDGPAGAGKSTTAKQVAERLGYVYIDSGAMYRACTWYVLKQHIELEEQAVVSAITDANVELRITEMGQKTFVNGIDISNELRGVDVTEHVSMISAFPGVRRRMVQQQRYLGIRGGVVMDGRDIGSVVFPHAEVKVFLVADAETRILRRMEQAQTMGQQLSVDVVRHQILDRDQFDSTRQDSPLVKAHDAVEIDTTDLTIDQQVQQILNLVSSYHTSYSLISSFGGI
jgi:CMP/dCMP kinase